MGERPTQPWLAALALRVGLPPVIGVEASPNIALIKYWGKVPNPSGHDEWRNLAVNPSISLTLSRARTRVEVTRAKTDLIIIQGERAESDDFEKMRAHMQRVWHWLCARDVVQGTRPSLRLSSENNFPASTGIASSASAFAALTLGFLGAFTDKATAENFFKTDVGELTALARRGSGSAARSLGGPLVKWDGPQARTLPFQWALRDTILILSREKKSVSSSEAHERIRSSPHFEPRLRRLPARLAAVECALERRDLSTLGPLLEEEALDIHHVAHSSTPSIDYLTADTRHVLAALQARTPRDYFFTLDAGPNVHVISERPVRAELEKILQDIGIKAEIWEDAAGHGPRFTS